MHKIPENKILITILSCHAQSSRMKDCLGTWIPLLNNNYHVIFLLGDEYLKSSSRLEIIDNKVSYLTLKVDDSFNGVSLKMKLMFDYLSKNTNLPYYWFTDNDTYVNTKLFNNFKDYSADWYGFGPMSHLDNGVNYNFMSGCGHYMSKSFVKLAAIKLPNWGHAYDAALGKVFNENKYFKRKYSSSIYPWSGDTKIDNLMIGHYVKDMQKMHSFYV